MRLNLGSGGKKLPGWVNVDSQPMENPDIVMDLAKGSWPWADSSVDEVMASHVLEHIAPGEPFFHVMKEIHRVCKPGAKVEIICPHPRHDIFLSDPTHINAVMPGTLVMFSKKQLEAMAKQELFLTPFYKYLGIDFDLGDVDYWFDKDTDKTDPELEWKAKHLSNVICQWRMILTVVK